MWFNLSSPSVGASLNLEYNKPYLSFAIIASKKAKLYGRRKCRDRQNVLHAQQPLCQEALPTWQKLGDIPPYTKRWSLLAPWISYLYWIVWPIDWSWTLQLLPISHGMTAIRTLSLRTQAPCLRIYMVRLYVGQQPLLNSQPVTSITVTWRNPLAVQPKWDFGSLPPQVLPDCKCLID